MRDNRHPPLRVALIMDCPAMQHGGVEILVRELVKQLAAQCEIILVTCDPRDEIPASMAAIIFAHVPLQTPHTRNSGDSLAAELQMQGVQLAHFHLGGTYCFNSRNYLQCPMTACKRAGIPYLITNHGVFGFFGYCGPQRSLAFKLALLSQAWLSRLLLIALSKGEIMVSNNDLCKMRRWFFPVSAMMGMVYHSVLPSTPHTQTALRVKRFLCVGTIGSRKGQWLLVRAFAQIHHHFPEWRLSIVGRFSDDKTRMLVLDAMSDPEVNAKIDLNHDATDEDIKQLYMSSEVFVMPSLEEGLGLTLQEALYHGCACVTTRAGGTEDLVTDGENGLLVDRNDAGQLADAMYKMAASPELRSLLSSRGQSSVVDKNMSREGMASRYQEIYSKCLGMPSSNLIISAIHSPH